jgi:2-iminobutanoate/2-iminopropanoate deaminase
MRKQVVHTDRVPPARVPLSQAIKAGDWVFVSGQLGIDPKTGKLAEGGIGAVDELGEMNQVFSAYFAVDPPARTTFECARLIRDARVEIEAVAMAS